MSHTPWIIDLLAVPVDSSGSYEDNGCLETDGPFVGSEIENAKNVLPGQVGQQVDWPEAVRLRPSVDRDRAFPGGAVVHECAAWCAPRLLPLGLHVLLTQQRAPAVLRKTFHPGR
jgi:hypothetical protein